VSYLIDGYNLMHAAGLMKTRFGPGGLEKARRGLVGILAASLGAEAANTTVVFDARVPTKLSDRETADSELNAPQLHGLRIEFATGEEDADARIEKLIVRDSAPRQLTVVSSDARIRRAARRRGAKPVESGEFWDKLIDRRRPGKTGDRAAGTAAAPAEKPSGRATADRDFWLREFDGLIAAEQLQELAAWFADEQIETDDSTPKPNKPHRS